jgi:hypothetical protein
MFGDGKLNKLRQTRILPRRLGQKSEYPTQHVRQIP